MEGLFLNIKEGPIWVYDRGPINNDIYILRASVGYGFATGFPAYFMDMHLWEYTWDEIIHPFEVMFGTRSHWSEEAFEA